MNMTQWTLDGDIAMQNLDIVRGANRIAMIDCENEALCDFDIMENAWLIAAAPDLLAALEEMTAMFADHAQYDDEGHETAAIAMARTAIAKAKGA